MTETQLEGRIVATREGSIFWITFDSPRRMNALTAAMWEDLPRVIGDAERDAEARIVILRGAGGDAFSAGADISEFETVRTGAHKARYDALNHDAFNAVADCDKPTIAMINGFCLGGGLEIALCCDLRVAAHGATFAIPSARLGIGYDPRWIRPLLASVTPTHAKEIMFTGRRFSDQEALAMGLINRLHPAAELEAATRGLAEQIAANAPLAVAAAKAAIDALADTGQAADLAPVDALVQACSESEDYAEGRAAFLEKRKPDFKGR
ncbi:MAG: enoyl-CoA hydratase [Methyloligellaceae bacterium]